MDLELVTVVASGVAEEVWQDRTAGQGEGTMAGALGAMLRNWRLFI